MVWLAAPRIFGGELVLLARVFVVARLAFRDVGIAHYLAAAAVAGFASPFGMKKTSTLAQAMVPARK